MIRRILTTTALAGTLATAAAAADSPDPIRLTLHDWTGQLITTHIMGEVLEKAGLNVEYVQADYLAQFAGLKTGDLDVAMEIWETTGREAMDEATATGQVVNLGETGMQAIEEWWYPLLHDRSGAPASPTGRPCSNPPAPRPSPRPRPRRTAATSAARHLGRLRRGAHRRTRPPLPGDPRRHRRRPLRQLESPTSARTRSCSGFTRRTGRR